MRIKVLSSAVDDLHAGRIFYGRQGEGLGEYFFDSLFSDAAICIGAIGIALFVLSLLPTEVLITRASGPSESYMLKGFARVTVLITGLSAFAVGMFVAGLWARWVGEK